MCNKQNVLTESEIQLAFLYIPTQTPNRMAIDRVVGPRTLSLMWIARRSIARNFIWGQKQIVLNFFQE